MRLASGCGDQQMTVASPTLMTTEEFLALPDDGVERWLIRGQLREQGKRMTVRNRDHSEIMALVSMFLGVWRAGLPEPRGVVVCGEAGARLRPDSIVGID